MADQGWELVAVYEDAPGRSEKPGDQPGMYALLENLSGLDKVVVVSLDRFRPGARGSLNTIQRLSAEGVGLVSVEEGFDTTADSGRAVPRVLRLAARWESRSEAGAAWGPEHLRKPGFDSVTVIDVGAGTARPISTGRFRRRGWCCWSRCTSISRRSNGCWQSGRVST